MVCQCHLLQRYEAYCTAYMAGEGYCKFTANRKPNRFTNMTNECLGLSRICWVSSRKAHCVLLSPMISAALLVNLSMTQHGIVIASESMIT